MTARRRPGPSWLRHPLTLGLLGVFVLALVYPALAGATQQPLGIFVVPVLLVSALGSWTDTASVGVAALGVAGVEGGVQGDFDATGLAARLAVIGVCCLIATVLAFERGRRQRLVDETTARGVLLDAFQDSLVPQPIPPSGVDVQTRYIPGDERLMLGGDFFDAIRLPNGSLGYIIGDVCGHGPRAAAFGAAVRSGWKTLATTAPGDPHHWVEGLDASFFRLGRHSDTYVTLNTGFVELEGDGRWCFISAGHPWPILVRPEVSLVQSQVGPPLGIGVSSAWRSTHHTLPSGSSVLLYTDGLIENPRPNQRKHNDGERQLLAYLRSSPFDIDGLLTFFGPKGFEDDVAVMAITRT